MIRNLIPLLEILSCACCIANTYGKKISCNIGVSLLIISEMVLLIGINDHGLPRYLISISYVLMFVYCMVTYKSSVLQSLINVFISVVLIGILQMLGYFILAVSFKERDMSNNNWEAFIMAFCLVISYFVVPKLKLNIFSDFLMHNKWISRVVGGFIGIIYISRIWKIKATSSLSGEDFIFTMYFVILIVLLLVEWQKSKKEVEKSELQLQKTKQYYGSYQEMIKSIREKQHDYKNHINAIKGMIYTSDSYEEVKEQGEKYIEAICTDNTETSIATRVENLVVAGFLSIRLREAESKGIKVQYSCAMDQRKLTIPEYRLVEMMGILIDNAFEAVLSLEKDLRVVNINLFIRDNKLYFKITNICLKEDVDKIPWFFKEKYSTKGENRGIGLSKLKKLVDDAKGEVHIMEDILENKTAVGIEMMLPI